MVDLMDFESRVAGLSALAEPVRLRIVDLLGAGDASPGELRAPCSSCRRTCWPIT